LVFRDEVVEVSFSFDKLGLVHPLSGVPVKEGLPPEHGGELLRDPLEDLLHAGTVPDEGGRHLETLGWDVTDGGLDVVWDPFDEGGAVLVLDG